MKLLVSVSITVGVMAIVVTGLYLWYRGPSFATISPLTKAVKGATSIDTSTERVVYDQVTLQIPRRFVSKQKTLGKGNPIYVQHLFSTPIRSEQGLFGEQLAVTVAVLPSGGLNDISAVQLRRRDANYKLTAEDPSYLVYDKLNGYEVGAFATSGVNYVSIVVSGSPSPEGQQLLKTELLAMVKSLIWR